MRTVSIEFTRLVFVYFVSVLAALLLLVASIRGAIEKHPGYRSDCAGMLIVSSMLLVDNFQSECRALLLFGDNQPARRKIFEGGADLFSVNGANAKAPCNAVSAPVILPAPSRLRCRSMTLSSDEPSYCPDEDVLKRRADKGCRVASFALAGSFRQNSPALRAEAPAGPMLMQRPVSLAPHSFTTSAGVTISFTLIMALNPSGTAFGPKVFMDADSKALVCAISPTDAESISAFRHSLAQAFVQQAANPGGGLPSKDVDDLFANNWAANATNGIMGGCLLGNNNGRGAIV
ncbi:hypothetical protein [Bradyrhizobium sp. LCT2]|uniref:hypothetical protein n=1 Tax=Bradyrhizobium sp. LCT2 TaxID=2493093 RepID=UPI001FEF0EE1|nr:hypothetical protein [Bradyrhizobium sp. LCT2]